MNPQNKRYFAMLIVVSVMTTLFCVKKPSLAIIKSIVNTIIVPTSLVTMRPLPNTTVDAYIYAQHLSINGIVDPPCYQTRNIYVCSGYCPWSNTPNNELTVCSFLPRTPHPDFVKLGIYCIPESDHCPTYNAWLKDALRSTFERIAQIPENLLSNFTLNNSVPIEYGYIDFRQYDTWLVEWTEKEIAKYRMELRQRADYGSYKSKDLFLAFDKYASIAVVNKSCAVIGTEYPWIEAALLEYNASMVTTIEYATIFSNVTRLKTITPRAFAQKQQSGTRSREFFDSVWSYSSLEHDGLGRYRDPLNPYGDLQTMTKIACILRPGGFLFLGIPLNRKDRLQFNLHRIYGPIRLPLMYRYYHVVEVLGLGMPNDTNKWTFQPFVVLQNKVHTVNDWEHADLGDEQRKQKFLRLMGAKKHVLEDRIETKNNTQLSEKKHCRSKVENEEIDRDLEKQFNESLQSKILHTHHEGLGFHANEKIPHNSDSIQPTSTKFIPATNQISSSISDQEKHKNAE
ncbi:unnamed protein product [Adineta ricciae]|uniref:Small acidic protein n=1 Tax=Adineta ricciae TaxID=249248 RepID=A0A814WBD5_ADIRI|nr:unnamed protein product [Adineta ricciae]